MNKNVNLLTILGFCAFISLMCSGFLWILDVCGARWDFLGTIKMIANIISSCILVICGWLWLSGTKMNKTLKIVLQVLFVIFAILAIFGHCGVHF